MAGEPFTATVPSEISRSAALASNSSAASDSTRWRSSREACSTAPLAMVAARLPPVATSAYGVTSVSP